MRAPGLLDLNEVLQHPGKKIEVPITTDLEGAPDVEMIAPIKGTLEAVSTGNLLLLSGKFEGRVIADCARCGTPIEVPIEFGVEEQFPVEGVAACYGMNDFARVVPDEPFPLFEGNSLMVDNLLRQDVIIAVPLQPLCQYGWEGPCPQAQTAQLKSIQATPSMGRSEFKKLEALKQSGKTSGGREAGSAAKGAGRRKRESKDRTS